jgi:hypothetical protein
MENSMSEKTNDLRLGSSRWPVGSQELQAVAYLPPAGPNYPEGLLVLATAEKCPELHCPAAASSPEQILVQLDELAAAISRHVSESKEALAKLGYRNSPIQPS